MSNINMSFDIEVAKVVGTDAAIILSNIEFWQNKNRANNHNFYDGKYWTYNSVKAWCDLFPYLSESKIRTCLNKLEDANYIITGNYNKSTYDRTKWYCSIRKMHLSKLTNGIDKTNEPIPIIKPDIKPIDVYKEKKIEFSEQIFLQRWKDARLHYDKMPTNIKKFTPTELVCFNELKKDYDKLDFERAIQGLFQQKTYPSTRLRPTHFLKRENFETYLTCYSTKEKLFENKEDTNIHQPKQKDIRYF